MIAAHAAFKSIMRKAMSEHGPLADGEKGTILDDNGNSVGTWGVDSD